MLVKKIISGNLLSTMLLVPRAHLSKDSFPWHQGRAVRSKSVIFLNSPGLLSKPVSCYGECHNSMFSVFLVGFYTCCCFVCSTIDIFSSLSSGIVQESWHVLPSCTYEVPGPIEPPDHLGVAKCLPWVWLTLGPRAFG